MKAFDHSVFDAGRPVEAVHARWQDNEFQANFVLDCANSVYHHLMDNVAVGKPAPIRPFREIMAHVQGELPKRRTSLIRGLGTMRGKTDTCSHELRAAVLMMNLAWELDLPRREQLDLGMSGLLHDIGKIVVPEAILDKAAALDADEAVIMRRHCEDGERLLLGFGVQSTTILDICRHHHERCDGSGYPDRLRGDEISRPARMAMICDVYDALTSRRAYKDAWSHSDAIAEMRSQAGQFDTELLDVFAASLHCLEG